MYPQSVALITVSVIFPLLALSAVCLRAWARSVSRVSFNASDYMILIAFIPALGQGILSIVGGTIGGLGAPLASLSPSVTTLFLKVLFGSQFFLIFSIILVKVSIVLFYKQIFITPRFQLVANITFVVLAATLIALFFVTLFQYHPISGNWTNNGTTIDYTVLYIFEGAFEPAYDLAILSLPLPMIRGLNLGRRGKWLLAGVFWLGGFCVIFSIVRLVYCVKFYQEFSGANDNFSHTVVNMILWATIGQSTQIIAACLPTMGPLLRRQRSSTNRSPKSFHQLGDGYSSMGAKLNAAHRSKTSGSVGEEEIEMEAPARKSARSNYL